MTVTRGFCQTKDRLLGLTKNKPKKKIPSRPFARRAA